MRSELLFSILDYISKLNLSLLKSKAFAGLSERALFLKVSISRVIVQFSGYASSFNCSRVRAAKAVLGIFKEINKAYD
ncbi:hypothetical protein UB51_02920 [Paenibacillus sp. IHBB 10380]|nr:hypothetical protein UB51_02920 [Paenibacillus sp. IHBB 10380]